MMCNIWFAFWVLNSSQLLQYCSDLNKLGLVMLQSALSSNKNCADYFFIWKIYLTVIKYIFKVFHQMSCI